MTKSGDTGSRYRGLVPAEAGVDSFPGYERNSGTVTWTRDIDGDPEKLTGPCDTDTDPGTLTGTWGH